MKIENDKECHDITTNLEDAYLEDGHLLLDPVVTTNGLLKILKKTRIIKDVCGILTYDYVSIPVAKVNIGILKTYDYDGVMKHFEELAKGGANV